MIRRQGMREVKMTTIEPSGITHRGKVKNRSRSSLTRLGPSCSHAMRNWKRSCLPGFCQVSFCRKVNFEVNQTTKLRNQFRQVRWHTRVYQWRERAPTRRQFPHVRTGANHHRKCQIGALLRADTGSKMGRANYSRRTRHYVLCTNRLGQDGCLFDADVEVWRKNI